MKQKPSYQELVQRVRELEASQLQTGHDLAGFIENAVVGFYRSTPGGRFLWVNTAFARILGYETSEALLAEGGDIQRRFFIRGRDRQELLSLIRDKGSVENHEFEIRQKNGDRIWVSETARARYDDKGDLDALEGLVIDISRRKQCEFGRKEAESFTHSLLNSLPVPVFYKDRDGRYRGFNRAFESFFGKKSRHMIGKSVFEINPRGLAEVYRAKDEELFDAGGTQRYETTVENALGEVKNVIFDKSVYRDGEGQISGLIGTVLDITDRKQAETALQESEARFRAIFDEANDGILVASAKTKRFVMANKVISRNMGYSRKELCRLSVYDIHPEDQVPEIVKAFETLAREQVRMVESIPVKRKDGSVFYADINASPIEVDGELLLIGIFRDITERRIMERALRKSEERFRELAELLPGAVVETDSRANISYVNRMGMKMFGYTEAEVAAGLNGLDLICRTQREGARNNLRKRLAGQEVDATEYRMTTRSGKEIWVMMNAASILRKGVVEGLRMVLTDISDRKAIEREREALIKDLQEALSEIKTLKGIVPICSKCKKIRDDQGYWNILETFIQEHSEASFSHSICPECSDSLYGEHDWYQKMKEKKKTRKKKG